MGCSSLVLTALGSITLAVVIFHFLCELVSQLKFYFLPKYTKEENFIAQFGGEWVVITGGSDGIGKGYAIELAKRGMNICVISNIENNIVKDIQNYGVECMWIDVDFSSLDVYDGIRQKLAPIIHNIGILINNVGITRSKMQALADQDEEFYKRIINVNMSAAVFMTKIVLPEMQSRNRGLIVNMGSIASSVIFPFASLYSASKSFIETYSVSLACELKHTNIRVKCIQPWFVNTGLVGNFSAVLSFLMKHMPSTFPDAPRFAKSVVATFPVDTPVCYNGYSAHSWIRFLIPFSFIKPQRMAEIVDWVRLVIIGEPVVKNLK